MSKKLSVTSGIKYEYKYGSREKAREAAKDEAKKIFKEKYPGIEITSIYNTDFIQSSAMQVGDTKCTKGWIGVAEAELKQVGIKSTSLNHYSKLDATIDAEERLKEKYPDALFITTDPYEVKGVWYATASGYIQQYSKQIKEVDTVENLTEEINNKLQRCVFKKKEEAINYAKSELLKKYPNAKDIVTSTCEHDFINGEGEQFKVYSSVIVRFLNKDDTTTTTNITIADLERFKNEILNCIKENSLSSNTVYESCLDALREHDMQELRGRIGAPSYISTGDYLLDTSADDKADKDE